VLALSVVYVAYFVLLTSFEIRGQERLPWKPDPVSGAVIVRDVAPGSVASSAGLRPGDRVLALDGRRVVDVLDWVVAVAHFPPDRPVGLEVEREGRTFSASLNPTSWTQTRALDGRMVLFFVSLRLPALTMALLLVWRRPRDPLALVGAWLMATLATATDVPREGMAAVWRGLPGPLAAVLWIPYASGLLGGAIIFTFTVVFPRPLVRRARVWVLLWLPSLVWLAWLTPVLARVAAEGRTGPGDLQYVLRLSPVNLPYLLGSLTALVLGYRRLTDVNERRRVRVLVAGAIVALLAPLPVALMQAAEGSTAPVVSALAQVTNLLAAFFPLSFAYAVLRHRLFDLRLVVRAGVRYALARRTLLALVPLLGGVLVLDLLFHGDQPLRAVLAERGFPYAGLAALALVARARQDRWLAALDRRFFRERYDAVRILREVVGDVERDASPTEAGLHAVAAIEAALHPEFVALLLEEPQAGRVRATAVAPVGRVVPSWPADSRLLAVLQALAAPLQVTTAQAAGVTEGLPAEEVARLEQSGIDLVVPVRVPGRKAFLALGPKRSAEPWDREERDLLATVAVGLGALARREQSAATPAASPSPALGERYRLGRLLGSGGMGVVYDATDRQLGRRVAVKFLRQDRISRADAESRFRREAQALAAFSHPNVVTIHDFGVSSDGRAFLVMEFLEGPTLRVLLRQERPLPTPHTLEILGGITAAVQAAHRRRLVHRDLKPENVILARGEEGDVPKVLDFGLARMLPDGHASQGDTATRGIVGTPRYMAPEQMTGGSIDPSWDCWALSVIAYEMLTGTYPFEGGEASDGRAALLAGRFRPVRLASGGTAPALDAFFSRAFARQPEDRPASAAALLSGLREALAEPGRPD
jgi:tRNA A-37 threonylcarbamoyl transferase component Bud32